MATDSGKIVAAYFDNAAKQLNQDNSYAKNVDVDSIPAATMQNTNNTYWRNVEQQAEVLDGWDLTGQEQDTIEQMYPLKLGTPKNAFKGYRVDELRDKGFMERASIASAKRLSSDQNKRIADLVANTGSLYYESASSDYDFVAEADTLMTERQVNRDMGSYFMLNPRANQAMGGNLASRSLYPGNRSEKAYSTALIGEDVAGFDLMRAPTYGTVTAAQAGTTTVAADVLDVPQGAIDVGVDSSQNIDYRIGTVTVASAATFQVGDVITFAGSNALGVNDKTDTEQLATAKITDINGAVISYYPKLIAADQAGISPAEAAYANISTAILTGAVVSKVNTVGGQTNSFWAKDSICIVNGEAPLELLSEFDGMKVVSETLDSGVRLYMAYDARLDSLQCRVRLFTWYGLVNKDPSRNGNAIYTP